MADQSPAPTADAHLAAAPRRRTPVLLIAGLAVAAATPALAATGAGMVGPETALGMGIALAVVVSTVYTFAVVSARRADRAALPARVRRRDARRPL